MEFIDCIIVFGLPALWLFIMVKTCKAETRGQLILHTVLTVLASLLFSYIVMRIIFSRVDETYSGNNIGALGFLFMAFLQVNALGMLIGLAVNIDRFEHRKHRKGKDKSNER